MLNLQATGQLAPGSRGQADTRCQFAQLAHGIHVCDVDYHPGRMLFSQRAGIGLQPFTGQSIIPNQKQRPNTGQLQRPVCCIPRAQFRCVNG
ncbi:Uncharacterised protein [Klebsiella grimontii]|nr:Uncharacterised protein [Klebsiella grimontii]